MVWTPEQLIALAREVAWPAVTLLGLLLFGPSLGAGLRRGFNIRQVKAFGATVEFAEAALPAPAIEDMRSAEHALDMIDAGPSGRDFVVEALRRAPAGGALMVNLGHGDRWLASRLFALARLGEARGLRAVALLSGGGRGGFSNEGAYLGAITPGALAFGLGAQFPWFERAMDAAVEQTEALYPGAPRGALIDALAGPDETPRSLGAPRRTAMLEDLLRNVMDAYLASPEIGLYGAPPAALAPEWTPIEGSDRFEHGPWLDASGLSRMIWRDLDPLSVNARGPILDADALTRIAGTAGEIVGVRDGRTLRLLATKAALFDAAMAARGQA